MAIADNTTSVLAQVAVDHLNMLVSLVEEMTCKWERQLEDVGEGSWDDDMLAKEGTDGEGGERSATTCPSTYGTNQCVTWINSLAPPPDV